MNTLPLAYIDENYTITFEVQSILEVTKDDMFDPRLFEALILSTVGEFGKTVVLPRAFFVMEEAHLDAFLLDIATRLPTIINHFYMAVPTLKASKLISNNTASYYRVKGYNADNMAVEALTPAIENTQEVVWGAHELVLRAFTYV